jgi:hypothetical protein
MKQHQPLMMEMACCYLDTWGGMSICKSLIFLLSSQHELPAYPETSNDLWILKCTTGTQYQLPSSETFAKAEQPESNISWDIEHRNHR